MMNKIQKKENFKSLVLLALPIVIEEVLSTLLQYVDTAMVGHLGAKATSSVSLTSTVNWLIYSLFSSLSIAVVALISRALGAGEEEKIKKASGTSFTLSLISGFVIMALALLLSPYIPTWMNASEEIRESASSYFFIISLAIPSRAFIIIASANMRAIKDSKTPMVINLSANLLNIVLNYLLIYTAKLGTNGAAIATFISYFLASIATFFIWRHKRLLRFSIKETKPEKPLLKEIFNIALPAVATNTTSCLAHIVFASLVSSMGTIIFAAHSIALSAETIFYVPGYGLRGATSTLIGISVGEKDREKFKTIQSQSIILTLLMMTVTGLLLFLFSRSIMSFFTPDITVIDKGEEILKLIAFTEPLFGLMIASEGVYYGLGETKYTFIIETIGAWGIRILFTSIAIKVFNMSLFGVWICMALDNAFRALGLALPLLFKRGEKLFIKKTA